MAQQTEKTLEIWTDGACKCNPGIGGWGAYMVWGAHTREMYGGSKLTTNNQMELTAVISALSALRRKCPIIIHTDSSYVKDGITKWIHGWKRNGWRTADKKPVKNAELWQQLCSAYRLSIFSPGKCPNTANTPLSRSHSFRKQAK